MDRSIGRQHVDEICGDGEHQIAIRGLNCFDPFSSDHNEGEITDPEVMG